MCKRLALLVVLVMIPGWRAVGEGLSAPVVDLIVHAHTRASDGACSMAEFAERASKAGADFVVVSDHAELITLEAAAPEANPRPEERRPPRLGPDLLPEPSARKRRVSRYPLAAWKDDLRSAGNGVIPGMEVGLIVRDADDPTDRQAHVLFIGGSVEDDTYDRVVALTENGQATTAIGARASLMQLLELAREKGAIVIGGHPSLWGWTLASPFRGPCPHCSVMGLEFFTTPLFPNLTPDTFRMLQHLPQPAIAIGGCDYHGGLSGLVAGLDRYTVVCTDSREPADVLAGLREGRCYAACNRARITKGVQLIGHEVDPRQDFEMEFSGLPETREGPNRVLVLCVPNEGAAEVVEPEMDGGVLRMAPLRRALPRAMADGGWIYVAAPAARARIVTSAIAVRPWRRHRRSANP